jgi:hypothetical protein
MNRIIASLALAVALASALPAGAQTAPPLPVPVPSPAPSPGSLPPGPAAEAIAVARITLANGLPVPETWPLGFSATLSATTSTAGSLPGSIGWVIDPPWIDQHSSRFENGRIVAVGTGTRPKTVTITLTVARADTFATQTIRLRFVANPDEPGDPTPTPKPLDPAPLDPPTPSPLPTPSPADTFGLEAFTRATLAACPFSAKDRTPGLTSIAAILGNQAARAAKYTSAQQLSHDTAAAIHAALGDAAYAAWQPVLFAPLKAQWAALMAKGKLLTVAELAEAYTESARAIESSLGGSP